MQNPLNKFARHLRVVPALLTVSALAACAGDQSAARPDLRGVGTPSVASHMTAEQATDLQALLERCRQVPWQSSTPPRPQTVEAACDELHRTVRNQPGNSVSAGGISTRGS